jgi:hypothetical protein
VAVDAEAVPSRAGEDQESARDRREWERIAYGPDASAEERRAAQEALDRLHPTAPGVDRVPGAADRGVDGPADAEQDTERDWAAAPDGEPSGPPPRPRFRFLGVAVALAVVATLLAVVALLPRLLTPASVDVFQRVQTDADQDIPMWLANALATAAGASATPGAGAAVHATVRLVEDDERSAFVFTDANAETVCMAVAADALACVPADEFARDGIRIDVVDKRVPTVAGGLSYEWGPRGELRADAFELGARVRAIPMAAGSWSMLVVRCMADRGYTVSTTPEGGVLAESSRQGSLLGFTINRVGCTSRYALDGVYFGPIGP